MEGIFNEQSWAAGNGARGPDCCPNLPLDSYGVTRHLGGGGVGHGGGGLRLGLAAWEEREAQGEGGVEREERGRGRSNCYILA